MTTSIRKATLPDMQVVHNIISMVPWISEATKSAEGFIKAQEACARGEFFVLTVDSTIVAMMMLRKDRIAASCGYNIWRIPLIVTIESERRKGHARRLVRRAKQVIRRATLCAHPENRKSLALLKSEGFTRVRGQTDQSGHPLYEWSAESPPVGREGK